MCVPLETVYLPVMLKSRFSLVTRLCTRTLPVAVSIMAIVDGLGASI